MNPSAVALAAVSLACSVPLAEANAPEVPVWPGEVPGEASYTPPAGLEVDSTRDGVRRFGLVTRPTLTLFPAPKEKAQPVTILVCPGGGYNILAWDKEGTEVAAWLNGMGVSVAVLKYRVPRRDPDAPHVAPLQDAQRALRVLRQRGKEWGLPVEKLGMLGFSAGGHLTVMTAVSHAETTYPRVDAADALSARPDFILPIYPAYLGDEKVPGPLSPLVKVTKDTPPTFVAVTDDDVLRGLNAASLYIELKKAGVLSELHIYTKGGHGYGLRPTPNPVRDWPKLAEGWLRAMGVVQAP
jgi:acetyl esterase/lipase